MLPMRPRYLSSGQAGPQPYTTPTFIDANFQATMASAAPPTYPNPASFMGAGFGALWWVFVDQAHGRSPYIAWTNGASALVKARDVVARGADASWASYDGRAAGPMSAVAVPVIDDAFLRGLWAWLKKRQREGVGVITQIELDSVARAARSREMTPGLARAVMIAAFHSGGPTGGSRFTLTSPQQLVLYLDGSMPEYGVPIGAFQTPISPKALINNLGNVPRSGLSFVDSLRLDAASAPAPSAPATSTPSPTAPPLQTSLLGVAGYSQAKPPTSVTFGTPTSTTTAPPSQTTVGASQRELAVQGGAQQGGAQGGAQQGGAQGGLSPTSAATSIADVAKKAWPYAVGAGIVLAVAGGGYYLYTRSQET